MSARLAVFLFALALCPGVSAAVPVVRINWDSCSGPVNKQVLNPNIYTLSVSVTGHGQAHSAHDFFLTIVGTPFPDAWRFDDAGCQYPGDPKFACSFKTSLSDFDCYSFMGPGPVFFLPVVRYNFDPMTGKASVICAAAYAPVTGTAFTRYLLGRLTFDHSISSSETTVETCGGIATPMCITMTQADWVDGNNQEFPFVIEQARLTANDATGGVCDAATPARATTWGSIRQLYRR